MNRLRGAQFLLTFVFLGQMATRASNLDTIGVTLLQAATTNVNGARIRMAQPEAGYETATNWEVNPGAGRDEQTKRRPAERDECGAVFLAVAMSVIFSSIRFLSRLSKTN
jgi:hypothetical protein